MRVIGSGFGRTGTLSTKQALEELGFGPCYHMEEVFRQPTTHVPIWHAHARGEPVDWERLFDGYEAAVDFPASLVYRELLDVFPDAKVVHTVRDPDRWYDSTRETIYAARSIWPCWARTLIPPVRRAAEMVDGLIWDGLFEGRFEDRAFAIERYESWTDEVVATVPADRLLVFEVKNGWGPLCEFLDVLEPASPFPNVNDRESMLQRFAIARRVGRVAPIVGALAAAGAALGLRRLFGRKARP